MKALVSLFLVSVVTLCFMPAMATGAGMKHSFSNKTHAVFPEHSGKNLNKKIGHIKTGKCSMTRSLEPVSP
jgi:hypothetical protein